MGSDNYDVTVFFFVQDIRGCWRISDAGVRIVGEYCPHLRVLNVTDCRDVSEQSLGVLRQNGVRIDRALNPLQLARMRLDARMRPQPPVGLQVQSLFSPLDPGINHVKKCIIRNDKISCKFFDSALLLFKLNYNIVVS